MDIAGKIGYNALPAKNKIATVVFTNGQIFIGRIDVLAPVNKDNRSCSKTAFYYLLWEA